MSRDGVVSPGANPSRRYCSSDQKVAPVSRSCSKDPMPAWRWARFKWSIWR